MIKWTESLSVGNETIDSQHKELIQKINDVLEACNRQHGKEKVVEVMQFLKDYTVKHFKDEENLMKKYQYPMYEEHKKIHEDLVKKVEDLDERIKREGVSLSVVMTVNKTLVDWFVNHISKEDKKVGEYIKNRK
ncbi:hemerythrin [Caldanaerobacter subterraneus subsp. tengcongensis MB4]|uniref:Hemerythrin n=2 Tax=Caldanaerobacter subterraneus TaxID=911092 RepID=Q8RCZ5_CALS4|nr:Hemerythrin [Caldanaerobacter subterraneus subsp. tengcongensis MB4]KKC30676.1 hemerythrin [Caldanaerobacter subterraneus subsp. pacificus DSM 12653]MCS3916961.1 hemerythrin [Caldanaerobacter subterraneus subsp. tengcongensis MB4]